MPLFDTYVMVDWSAGDRRRAGKEHCIWVAHGPASAAVPSTFSPPSRTDAEHAIRALLEPLVETGNARALVCFDFAYGYPAGFASLLPPAVDGSLPPWRVVWQYLATHVNDDLGTKPGRPPTNRSNRFAVANAINAAVENAGIAGPFWCVFERGSHAHVPQRQPPQPFIHAGGTMAALRLTDRRANSDTPFRLFGTGSVGGQVITGIPRLERLRFDPRLATCSAVWPFETGWAPAHGPWLAPELRILHAEIYPSVRAALPDPIKDCGQVRAMWEWARQRDAHDLLAHDLALPPGITNGSPDDLVIRGEEGWILGCPE